MAAPLNKTGFGLGCLLKKEDEPPGSGSTGVDPCRVVCNIPDVQTYAANALESDIHIRDSRRPQLRRKGNM